MYYLKKLLKINWTSAYFNEHSCRFADSMCGMGNEAGAFVCSTDPGNCSALCGDDGCLWTAL